MTEKGKCHSPPKLFILTVSGAFANFMTFLEAKSYARFFKKSYVILWFYIYIYVYILQLMSSLWEVFLKNKLEMKRLITTVPKFYNILKLPPSYF